MPRAFYDPYGIFPSPKPHRRARYRRPNSINRFDLIGVQRSESGPTIMDRMLVVDYAITEYLFSMGNEWSHTGGAFRTIAKIMEWTMHGIPWLAGVLIAIFVTDSRVAAHLLINLFFAILLDLTVIGTLKAAFRRKRPHNNPGNMLAEAPYVDQFSFPSGHTSRAAMLAKLLITLTAMEFRTKLAIACFPVSLGVSRIMLGRHYFSDVVAGILIGLVECDVATYFWLSPESCLYLWRLARWEFDYVK